MPNWNIVAVGEAREVYNVIAASEEEAREKFAAGDCSGPYLTEVSGSEIVEIEEVD